MVGCVELRIRRKISDTICGEVYECEIPRPAETEDSDVPVFAVKVISLSLATILEEDSISRTIDSPLQEIAVSRILSSGPQHPHIVIQYDQVTREDTIYIVSEYCGGGDLYSYLDAQHPNRWLTENEAADFMHQIVKGVQFLHETIGIAHRDLSLENILLTADGVCKITDFALSVDAREMCHDCAGKDLYMAPEVVARSSYDPVKADIWSLGVMWFILLTGSSFLPIASLSSDVVRGIDRHGISVVLRKWRIVDRISPVTVELLDSMLRVDPQRRCSLQFVLDHPALSRCLRVL